MSFCGREHDRSGYVSITNVPECSNEEPLQVSRKNITLSIDELLIVVGEYGTFQKIVNLMFCITVFPCAYPLLITYFTTKNPSWKCISNSTACSYHNKTFSNTNTARCTMPRTEWEYVTPRDYSIVTEFDLICDKDFLIELATSIFFFGFIFGAYVIGWFADNFGRKKMHYISLTVVILVGCISVFVGNIYAFVVCRFVIGFFMHGTYPQMFVIIAEIVGNKHRALCNNTIFLTLGFAFSFLALKAYLISSWKILFVVCTVPYSFVLLFYMFVPESVRYLRVKGEISEAMLVFQRMAYWNKTELPPDVIIKPAPVNTTSHKTSPLDLFRTRKMASISTILGWAAFTGATAFYCLYLSAGNITGHMYTDFVVITVLDVPMGLINTPLTNRFGRKRISMILMLFAGVSCIALGVTPRHDKMNMLRLMFGMIGKTCIMGSAMSLGVWSIELYPTHIRGEGIGFVQVLNKIGATSSAWLNKEFSKIYDGGAFILVGILIISSFCLQIILPETKGVDMTDI